MCNARARLETLIGYAAKGQARRVNKKGDPIPRGQSFRDYTFHSPHIDTSERQKERQRRREGSSSAVIVDNWKTVARARHRTGSKRDETTARRACAAGASFVWTDPTRPDAIRIHRCTLNGTRFGAVRRDALRGRRSLLVSRFKRPRARAHNGSQPVRGIHSEKRQCCIYSRARAHTRYTYGGDRRARACVYQPVDRRYLFTVETGRGSVPVAHIRLPKVNSACVYVRM